MGEENALRSLARAHGIQSSYTDTGGRRRTSPRESLLAALRLLGAPLARASDAAQALLAHERAAWQCIVDPVRVVRPDEPATFTIRVARRRSTSRAVCRIAMENGETRELTPDLSALRRARTAEVGRERYVELELTLPGPWPAGYHRLRVEVAGRAAECVVVVAPRRAFGDDGTRAWGAFLPLHALHRERGRGVGHYGDLGALVDWTADLGGRTVGTLPLLARVRGEPFDPSPYLPDSRLLWDDFYVDWQVVPELEHSAEARALLRSGRMRRRLADLRAAAIVDYPRHASIQREVLEALFRTLLASGGERQRSFRRFLRARPEVAAFARYRALAERLERSSSPAPADYHAYTQWLAAGQVEALGRRAAERGVRLYLDLPLGVHPEGFDVRREPALFARGAAVGAPPDDFFAAGQSWSFPPVHPLRAREQGHRYFAACLRHQMRVAGMLRVDHVMGLHRQFWIPEGFGADAGVYVHYPAEELYAVICLESQRQRCVVAGEDLGTVPRSVRPAMRRHGLRRTFVLQFASGPDRKRPLVGLDVCGVATLNTHDLPTFAAFWSGLAPALRRAWTRELRRGGWLSVKDPGTTAALRACVAYLAQSPAEVVLIGLEDLWSERRPQNVPGTTTERANWCGRTRYPFEVFTKMPRVLRTLRELQRRRGEPR